MENEWDDIALDDIEAQEADPEEGPAQGTEPEAGSPHTAETGEPESPSAAIEAEEPTMYELSHYSGNRSVTLEEMRALAQKGLDWDNMKAERDTARATYAAHEEFLKELADGGDIETMIDSVRARRMAQAENIDENTAMQRVQLNKERKAFEVEKAAAAPKRDPAVEARQKMFLSFHQNYPDVKADSIPKDVWAAVNAGADLTTAYAMHEAKSLRDRLAAMEQNQKNSARSTGSMSATGESTEDEFDRLWNDGT